VKDFTLSFVIIALLFARVDVFGQERVEAPTFIDGDFWQYRVVEHGEYMKTDRELNGIYEIAYSNGQFKAFKLETNQKNELRSGESVLTGLIGQTALQHLQFPTLQRQIMDHGLHVQATA
jgi:hypothetical protein